MTDIGDVRRLAAAALRAEGIPADAGDIAARRITGAWRCWASPGDRVLGNVHVLVADRDGRTRPIPVGLPDDLAALELSE